MKREVKLPTFVRLCSFSFHLLASCCSSSRPAAAAAAKKKKEREKRVERDMKRGTGPTDLGSPHADFWNGGIKTERRPATGAAHRHERDNK